MEKLGGSQETSRKILLPKRPGNCRGPGRFPLVTAATSIQGDGASQRDRGTLLSDYYSSPAHLLPHVFSRDAQAGDTQDVRRRVGELEVARRCMESNPPEVQSWESTQPRVRNE